MRRSARITLARPQSPLALALMGLPRHALRYRRAIRIHHYCRIQSIRGRHRQLLRPPLLSGFSDEKTVAKQSRGGGGRVFLSGAASGAVYFWYYTNRLDRVGE